MAAGANPARLGPRPTVLVVEDDADICELLRYNLEQEGFAVERHLHRCGGA